MTWLLPMAIILPMAGAALTLRGQSAADGCSGSISVGGDLAHPAGRRTGDAAAGRPTPDRWSCTSAAGPRRSGITLVADRAGRVDAGGLDDRVAGGAGLRASRRAWPTEVEPGDAGLDLPPDVPDPGHRRVQRLHRRRSVQPVRQLRDPADRQLCAADHRRHQGAYAKGKGIVVNEPSIVAINKNTGEVEAVGKEAKDMLGRTPGNIVAIRPMKDGVIADFKVTERMLNYFIQKAHGRKMLVHPRIIIGVPSEITQVEKRAVIDSAYHAKASEVFLVEQAMVAAIGAGLPVTEPSGNMVVDIGGGTTDVAVISLSGIVYSRSVRVAGNEMDDAIMQYMKRKYNLLIGETTAEKVKIQIGSAYPLDKPLTMEIKGRNLIEGVPKTVTVDDTEIREALSDGIATIMNAIRVALERTPPELSADISDRGIVLTGGGALIRNLDRRIRHETGLPVSIAEDPLASVVLGTGKMLTEFKLLRRIAVE